MNTVAPETTADTADTGARQTAPGVKMLKDVWRIEDGKKEKEMPPPDVPTDIYCVPKSRPNPRRRRGLRSE